jgi:hypothetical protein
VLAALFAAAAVIVVLGVVGAVRAVMVLGTVLILTSG